MGVKSEQFTVAIICTDRHARPKCFYCHRASDFLCDYPVFVNGQKKGTCDRRLCARCRLRGISKDVDFCRKHYQLARAAFERRQAKRKKV